MAAVSVAPSPLSFHQTLPGGPFCDNGPSEPNAFERQLANDAADRIDRKEMIRRKNRKGLKRQWQRGALDSITICKKLAEKRGQFGASAWLEIYGALEERDGKTLRALAKLRKELTDKHFPREPWEVEEDERRDAKREKAREKARERARARAKARRFATDAAKRRAKLLSAQAVQAEEAEQDAEEELVDLDLQLAEEDEA